MGWAIAIHGGAGDIPISLPVEHRAPREATLRHCLDLGVAALRANRPPLDVVELVVRELENSPCYNAGKGSVLTTAGTVEMEACIMDGNTKNCGAVSGLSTVVNAISLARLVMEKTPHIYLAFDGAEAFAREQGVETMDPSHFITPQNIERLKNAKEANRVQIDYTQPIKANSASDQGDSQIGTVGCVAVDNHGNLASATSTGGLVNKMVGRIGDTPMIGSGTYANSFCAVSATGKGESIIRATVARDVAAFPECSLCRRTNRPCIYGVTPDPMPTASDWGFLQARLAMLENRLPDSSPVSAPSSVSASVSASISAPASALTAGTTVCESVGDIHSPGPSHATSVALTPAQSASEDAGPEPEIHFPAAMFLDIDCFIWSHTRLPPPRSVIPSSVLALLSQGNVVLDVSRSYFATIHTWLPMISKKRMDLGLPVQNAGPDLAMLFLGMKLITTPATDIVNTPLYRTAKDFLARLESNGTVSLLTLQSMVLVALYEYGHAIYPAAWMTIGSCARYADILGLTSGEYPVLGQATTWTEAEERRRVWWSIFILDKIVSLGSRKPCVMPEPLIDYRLPVDDEAWDCGEVSKAVGRPTSTAYQVKQSGYARLCQAAIYLGRAIKFARGNPASRITPVAEIMALAQDLTGFGAVLDAEGASQGLEQSFTLLGPRLLVRSALFVALDRFTCPEKVGAGPGYIIDHDAKTHNELELQMESMQIFEKESEGLHALAMSLLPVLRSVTEDGTNHPYVLDLVNPFIMDSIYAAAATFHWIVGENGKDVYRTAAADMDMFLDTLSLRWRLGSVYREMLTVHDVSARVEANSMLR